jgi:predicted acetyltransferase
MEIRKLKASDYDELLSLLNTAFQRNDFDRLLPKMWQRDDEYMGKHFGLFEDSKLLAAVGIYPFKVHIGDKVLNFATTGNVATHPDHEGKGYFSKLFELTMAELEKEGFDAARLGGARQRYGRFGYEPCGSIYKFTFTKANREKCFDKSYEDIEISELSANDIAGIKFTDELYTSLPFYVERYGKFKEADVFGTLGGKSCERFIAKRNVEPIGYICANNSVKYVAEIGADNTQNYMDIICAWQK